MRVIILLSCVVFALSCSDSANKPGVAAGSNSNRPTSARTAQPLPVYGYEVVRVLPHDPRAFTQGLIYHDGFLYESTGQQRRSSLRKIDANSGLIVQKVDMAPEDFSEGITLLNGKIYMLTYQQGVGRVFNLDDLKQEGEFNYIGEGWGLTNDGTNLYMTQGAHVIKVIEPGTFRTLKTIPVMRPDGQPQMRLNELEFVKGEIWANIWHSEEPETLGRPNYIARIDPANGKIVGWIDLGGISPDDQPPPNETDRMHPKNENTLNGIAYDPATERIWVTGKNWKKMYEIRLKAPQGQ